MAEHPILFTGKMAIKIMTCAKCGTITTDAKCPKCGSRERLKTQTRRIINPQPIEKRCGWPPEPDKLSWYWKDEYLGAPINLKDKCPYGKIGDTLWVRESFAIFDVDADEDIAIGYKADDTYKTVEWFKDKRKEFKNLRLGKWRSSIFMPRWATRIFLKITNIRVERVQDISEKDSIAEGVITGSSAMGHIFTAKEHFKGLWDSINAKRGFSWNSNPFVWVITFKRNIK